MKKKNITSGLFNYAVSIALAVIFALYLSGRVGWFLLAAFLAAPLLSVLLSLIFRNRIYVVSDTQSVTLTKGDKISVDVTIGNSMWLPSPPIFVSGRQVIGADLTASEFSCSVMPLSEENITLEYRAKISGPYKAGISDVYMTDYLGIFTFRLKNADPERLDLKLNVIPDIAEVPYNNRILRQASELTAMADDSEDTVSSANARYGGFPGYDNREYVPGDPLKRINWKQSAKRGMLLVRLDDETAASAVSIVLDHYLDRNNIKAPLLHSSQRIIGNSTEELTELAVQWSVEYGLGIARSFIRENYTVSFFFCDNDGWQHFPLADENDLVQLQTALASYTCTDKAVARLPKDELSEQKGSVSVICTPYYDLSLNEALGSDQFTSVVAAAVTVPELMEEEISD